MHKAAAAAKRKMIAVHIPHFNDKQNTAIYILFHAFLSFHCRSLCKEHETKKK
jgi:hypothetical protein